MLRPKSKSKLFWTAVENFEKDGKQYENKVIKAKSIALCLNQLGIESIKFRAPEKKAGKSQTPELDR